MHGQRLGEISNFKNLEPPSPTMTAVHQTSSGSRQQQWQMLEWTGYVTAIITSAITSGLLQSTISTSPLLLVAGITMSRLRLATH